MRPSEELLIAYADGELSGEELRAVESALKSDPALQRFVAQQQALRQHIEGTFAPYLTENVPDRLRETLAHAPASWRWRLQQMLASPRRPLLWSGFATGAALAFGVVLGILIAPQGAFRVDRDTGALMARGALSDALDRQLASAQGTDIRIGVSFKSKDGHFCRTFENAGSKGSLAGVACRSAEGWSVAALAAAPTDNSAYRMAGAMPDTVRRAVAGMIAGEPLDAAAEKQARDAGWR
jgi:hypothetical protein